MRGTEVKTGSVCGDGVFTVVLAHMGCAGLEGFYTGYSIRCTSGGGNASINLSRNISLVGSHEALLRPSQEHLASEHAVRPA